MFPGITNPVKNSAQIQTKRMSPIYTINTNICKTHRGMSTALEKGDPEFDILTCAPFGEGFGAM